MELVPVGAYGSVIEANLVKARLEANDIDALVQADDLGATTPTLVASNGARVLVRRDDLAAAMEALERMLPPGS